MPIRRIKNPLPELIDASLDHSFDLVPTYYRVLNIWQISYKRHVSKWLPGPKSVCSLMRKKPSVPLAQDMLLQKLAYNEYEMGR